jgi:hypothetical protein
MKKIALFLVAALALSCNEDDSVEIVDNGLHHPYIGSVVGSWSTIGLRVNEEIINIDCNQEVPFEENYIFTFYEDNTFELYSNCESDATVIPVPVAEGTYSKSGNVLTMIIDGEEGKAHTIDLDEYLGLEDAEQLAFKFSIGSEGLFYGYDFAVERIPEID